MKRTLVALLLLVTLLFSIACATTPLAEQNSPTPERSATPEKTATAETGVKDGVYSGSALGFGGEITVTITVAGGALTDISAVGEQETAGIGSNAIDQLPPKILEAKSVDVDAVAGATITSSAVMQAVRTAMQEAGLLEATASTVKMQPGIYTGEANGFALCETLKVTVTVDETKITDICVNMTETAETAPILESTVNLLIPRMIENQSVRVDCITGATATSSAIKIAVEDCLQQALTAGGSSADVISQFYTPTQKKTETVELSADVLVIGMGGSGTTAAMSAAENGAKVLAIDKAGKYGGTTSLTSEIMAINPPRIQKEHNNGKDWVDVGAMRKAWLAYTEGDAKSEMVDILLESSGEAIDWLVYEHGYEFDYTPKKGFTEADVFAVKYQFLPNDIGANKAFIAKYFDGIYEDFTAAGGEYMLETEGYELMQGSDGSVTGAKARNMVDGTEYIIHAKAVIIATGGFAGNVEMEEKYLSDEYFELKGAWSQFGLTINDGKMLQAAIDLGAGTYNIGVAPIVHNAATPAFLAGYETVAVEGQIGARTGRPLVWSAGDLPMDMVISRDSLAVNKHGKRFTNEMDVAMLNAWIAGPRFYSIWSTPQIDTIRDSGFSFTPSGPATIYLGYQGAIPEKTPIANAYDVLEDAIAKGIAYKADTLDELARQLGMEPEVLQSTVETYNGYCEAGKDEEFGKSAEYLAAIGDGPYYAIAGAPWCYSSTGGLNINTEFEVLKADGVTPISGLYAVGTDSAGVLYTEKKAYVTFGGAANGWAITSGKLAGEIAAKAIAG